MLSALSISALVALIPLVAGHGHLDSVLSGGTNYTLTGPSWVYNDIPSASWRAGNQDNGFIDSSAATLAGGSVACGKINGSAPGVALPAKGASIPVAAGSPLTVHWQSWAQHPGPTITYMAKCAGKCADLTDATALQWFKVRQTGWTPNGPGLATESQKWEATALGKEEPLTTVITVPAQLQAGEYVVFHEIIALHGAGTAGGAQLYPMCFNVAVSGGGSLAPTGTIGSELYTSTDPSILISIWYPLPSNYVIPGPAFPTSFANPAKREVEFTA